MRKALAWGVSAALVTALVSALVLAQMERKPSAADAEVYFINLADGDTVSSPFLVQFGLSGMGVAPAGFDAENSGHHHLLINQDEAEINYGMPLPATESIIHFGGGQTETLLELVPGSYDLQLLLGDFSHIPHNSPVISEKVSVTVE